MKGLDNEYTNVIQSDSPDPPTDAKEADMRRFLSVVLAGGLLLVGVDIFERREASLTGASGGTSVASIDDGTGLPPNFPPPPPPPR